MSAPHEKSAVPPADVFVFWTAVPTDLDVSDILSHLDAADRLRAARFHFAQDRAAFAVAHGLLRAGLDRVGGPHSWRFRQMPGGKPVLDGAHLPPLHFNLSHTRRLTAVAISRAGPLGVDVETIAGTRGHQDVAGLVFAPEEKALLQAAGGDRWDDVFFTLWTLKEAAVKATGQGLSADLPAFAFALDPPRLRTAGPDGSGEQDWSFHSSRVAGCRLAAALRAGPGTPAVFHLSEIPVAALSPASP